MAEGQEARCPECGGITETRLRQVVREELAPVRNAATDADRKRDGRLFAVSVASFLGIGIAWGALLFS